MSLFARSYHRLTNNHHQNSKTNNSSSNNGTTTTTSSSNNNDQQDYDGLKNLPNCSNITHRKKLSAVSTSINGDDGFVAASPRNCYQRNGNMVSSIRDRDDFRKPAAKFTDDMQSVENHTIIQQNAIELSAAVTTSTTNPSSSTAQQPNISKKSRTSTSSLASVFRSRASSPMERVRKFIGRSSSKSAIQKLDEKSIRIEELERNEQLLNKKVEQMRHEMEAVKLNLQEAQKVIRSTKEKANNKKDFQQQSEKVEMRDVEILTDAVDAQIDNLKSVEKENVNPKMKKFDSAIICLDDVTDQEKIHKLENEKAELIAELENQKMEFRTTRRDFILILREAVNRKNQAEEMYERLAKTVTDDADWSALMGDHRHALRRNVLLMWAQQKLKSYGIDNVQVSNFSSDWADCRAFCAIIYDCFPELMPDVNMPTEGDCVSRCRKAFLALEIPFDEKAMGLENSSDNDSCSSLSSTVPDWRYIMETVFLLYKISKK